MTKLYVSLDKTIKQQIKVLSTKHKSERLHEVTFNE